MDIHIPKDRETGRPRGFAFVRFAAEEHAQQAVEQFHGREVGGRALRLDIAEDRPRPQRPRRDFGGPPSGGRPPRNDFGRGDQGRPDQGPGGDYSHDRGYYDRDDDGGGGRGGGRGSFEKPKRPKGSRRGLRGKKRSL